MNKMKFGLAICSLLTAGIIMMAADHIEAPAVSGGSADITDFYVFQGENTSNLVFVANVQGLLSPTASETAAFDEDVLVEFNVDNDGDNVEDLVIQALPKGGNMYFFGPSAPASTGTSSTILNDATEANQVAITAYSATSPTIGQNSDGSMMFFAGPRDDPFFFDFTKYGEIIAGTATGFDNPGTDTFAGTNVMSVVVEVPKSMLGGSGTLNCWVETKRKS